MEYGSSSRAFRRRLWTWNGENWVCEFCQDEFVFCLLYLCAEMRLHCRVIDKVFCTMNAVKLCKTGLVQVHTLVDQLLGLLLNVLVDLKGVK